MKLRQRGGPQLCEAAKGSGGDGGVAGWRREETGAGGDGRFGGRRHGLSSRSRPSTTAKFRVVLRGGREVGGTPRQQREAEPGSACKSWHGKVPKHIDSAVSCVHVPRDIEKDSYNNSVFGLLFSQDISILSRKKNKLLKIKFS